MSKDEVWKKWYGKLLWQADGGRGWKSFDRGRRKRRSFACGRRPVGLLAEEQTEYHTGVYGCDGGGVVRLQSLSQRVVSSIPARFASSLGYYGLSMNVGHLGGNIYVNSILNALVRWEVGS